MKKVNVVHDLLTGIMAEMSETQKNFALFEDLSIGPAIVFYM